MGTDQLQLRHLSNAARSRRITKDLRTVAASVRTVTANLRTTARGDQRRSRFGARRIASALVNTSFADDTNRASRSQTARAHRAAQCAAGGLLAVNEGPAK